MGKKEPDGYEFGAKLSASSRGSFGPVGQGPGFGAWFPEQVNMRYILGCWDLRPHAD